MALNRYYYPTKYKSRTDVVALGVKCVFISHQKNDKEEAKQIADYLMTAGIDVYFDEYDTDLKLQHQSNNATGVTTAICNGINNSSHMLVLVSPHTMNSTWVPFEIGFGYDKTDLAALCLKGIPPGGLPEYIKAVKVIRDIWDLNTLVSNFSGKSKETLVEAKAIRDYSDMYNPLSSVMDRLIT